MRRGESQRQPAVPPEARHMTATISNLTYEWGSEKAVTLYLDRCQVDTPVTLVARVWEFIAARRDYVGTVLDLGAGDGRFARGGQYESYTGVEIDPSRAPSDPLPPNARIVHRCAFETQLPPVDVCLGNPPYVRNQDLPEGWRQRAASVIADRVGVHISGLANAWQYFAFLALGTAKTDGLIALVIPYEWVSRPSAAALRDYICNQGWDVDCYRLLDGTFEHVLTTCSITIVDKRARNGVWRFWEESREGFEQLASPSGNDRPLTYDAVRKRKIDGVRVKRGLSPGTQRWLVLTESARAFHGLQIGRDVVPCVTTLRVLGEDQGTLTRAAFARHYRDTGLRCWLIRTVGDPSDELSAYLNSVPEAERDNWTCNSRNEWWRFVMPIPPTLLVASGFRGAAPKAVVNQVGAIAVGGVTGIYGLSPAAGKSLLGRLRTADLRDQVVAHSNGFRKVEVGQLQALIESLLG
jgi:hypothetical protein